MPSGPGGKFLDHHLNSPIGIAAGPLLNSKWVEAYGMTHLICRTFFPGMPHAHIMKELDLLAREVLPAFK